MFEKIYGKNSIIEAIRNKREISDVMVTANNNDIISLLNKNNIKYQIVQRGTIEKILKQPVNHQGVLASVAEYHYYNLKDIINDSSDSLIVMLDGIEDPHNLGAIIRTCEISGASGIILPKNRSVKVNATVSKVSAGAIEHVKVVMVTNLINTIKTLKENGYWVVGAEALAESKNFWDLDLNMKVCLIIGSEGKGLSRLIKEECDFLVKIPMWGKVNSLNASVSAALLIYEIRRQQNKK